jgi:hypothetical protein
MAWIFRSSKLFPGGVVNLTPNPSTWKTKDYTSPDPCILICLTLVALPGAYAPVSIVLRVIEVLKPPRERDSMYRALGAYRESY